MPQTQGTTSKRVILFRNGDPNYEPVEYIYSQYKTRTFAKLLEDINRKVDARKQFRGHAGQVSSQLFTSQGERITSLEHFEGVEDNFIVVAGPEEFRQVNGGYESIIHQYENGRKPWKEIIPGDNKSYMDMHRERFGDVRNREPHERLHNRIPHPKITRIYCRRNNDKDFVPKLYVLRHAQTRTMEALLKDLEKLTGDPLDNSKAQKIVRDSDAKEVDDFEDFIEGDCYCVCGVTAYVPPREKQKPSDMQVNNKKNSARNVRGAGAHNRNDQGDERSGSAGNDSGYNGQQYEDDDTEDDYDDPYYQMTEEEHWQIYGRPRWKPIKATDEINWEEIEERDRQMLDTYYSKPDLYAHVQPGIMREDQFNPGDVRLFCFLNGKGNNSTVIVLTRAQQTRGINWTIERISKAFCVNGKKLMTMGGKRVNRTEDLIHCGAYVLVPLGETFRDTWYYLPEMAIDTSDEDAVNRARSQTADTEASRAGGRNQRSYSADDNRVRGGRVQPRDRAANHRGVGAAPPRGAQQSYNARRPAPQGRDAGRRGAPPQRGRQPQGRGQPQNRGRPQSARAPERRGPFGGARRPRSARGRLGRRGRAETTESLPPIDQGPKRRDSWGNEIYVKDADPMSRARGGLPAINQRPDNSNYKQKLQLDKQYSEFNIKQQSPTTRPFYGRVWRY